MRIQTLAIVAILFFCQICSAQTFTQITPAVCPSSSSGLFTTGQQYVDSGNGVLQNSWSMLVRWQGNPTVGNTSWVSHPLSYNAGMYTDYTPPTPYTSWQVGYTPESQGAGTPGVQLHCFDAGLIINTWTTPHSGAQVVGGAFNDMYGYAWSFQQRPAAFQAVRNGVLVPAELVLQSNLEVPILQGWSGLQQPGGAYTYTPITNLSDTGSYGTANADYFVYIQDTTHPSLHPIAILAGAFDNGYCGACYCGFGGPHGHVGFDYSTGVWYGSADICSTDVTTVRYTGSTTHSGAFTGQEFFRIHITPQNLTNLINRINSQECVAGYTNSCVNIKTFPSCNPGSGCPLNGYSTNPNDYIIQYVGMIAEVDLCDKNGTNVICATNLRDASLPNYNPGQDSNLSLTAHATGVSAFWYTNP